MVQPGDIFRMNNIPDNFIGVVLDSRYVEYLIVILSSIRCSSGKSQWAPKLIGMTFDTKFSHKHWVVLGNRIEVAEGMPRPVYQLWRRSKVVYEDFQANEASGDSLEGSSILPVPRTTVGPIRFENAARSILTGQDWKEEYDVIDYASHFEKALIKNYIIHT